MAKKKKTEDIIDLKPEKITNEQLDKVQDVINEINRCQIEIGVPETKKHNLLHHVTLIQEELRKLQVKFKENYGTDDINIKDGTINYENNEQTN